MGLATGARRAPRALLDDSVWCVPGRPAVAAASEPPWRRIELRYVDLKAGRRLQVTAYDETQAHTTNYADPAPVLDEMLAQPFANWHVETTTRPTSSG